jgi:hypothetical protein
MDAVSGIVVPQALAGESRSIVDRSALERTGT